MSEMIRVGMADYKLCAPPDKISTLGLGSCMGVVIYDTKTKLCGMAHIMLPDSTKITHNQNRMKFADTCLLDMYHELLARGGLKENLRAKIAGGAKMFAHHSDNELLNVGHHNNQAVRKFYRKRIFQLWRMIPEKISAARLYLTRNVSCCIFRWLV